MSGSKFDTNLSPIPWTNINKHKTFRLQEKLVIIETNINKIYLPACRQSPTYNYKMFPRLQCRMMF